MDVPALILDAVLGFTVSVCTRTAVLRFFAWYCIPIFIALVIIGPVQLATAEGESTLLWFSFAYLVGFGLIASGIGTLAGLFARRIAKARS